MNQSPEQISPERANALLHTLRVHQVELETQNEELRRTQFELELSRARYFDLYDQAPVGYFTISDGEIILEANLTAATLLGLQAKALVGKPIQDFILPTDQDIYYRHRQKLAETGLPQTCELRLEKKGIAPFWAQLIATRGQDATGEVVHRLVVTNIDESKRTKDRLRLSDSALKAITQGVLITTPQLVVVSANAAFLAMTGYTEAELVGQNSQLLNGPQSSELVIDSALESMAREQVFSSEVYTYRKDGSGFWNAFNISPVHDARGVLSHFISINTDISARKRLSEALELKNLELQAATNVAERANLAKSEFLSNMSHELRSPLNAIVGFAQLLESGDPAPTPLQQRNIDRILAGGWYLLKLINEILDLAMIESGKLALTLQPLSLGLLLRECQHLTESHAEKQNIGMQFADLEQPLWVVADAMRLKQVMVNLLSNAIKYNRTGGTVEVRVSTSAEDSLRISVTDTGEGLSPDKLAQLFESFNRLGRESTTTEGTGIGLVVSKKLTELMGGTIGVKSRFGVGSEFWVEFKAAHAPRDLHLPAHLALLQGEAPPDGADQPQCTVLYVEDNLANVDLVEQILARRGNVHMLSASDGLQGIALARQHQPQVILMDIHLLGMSGLEAMQVLRQDPLTRHIPVIAVSANAMPRDVVNGLSAGFFRYLTKPFQIDRFLEVLDLALAVSRTSQLSQRVR
jgi:PAS domain S-box-containing protein